MSAFREWEGQIKLYCDENNIDYHALRSMRVEWGVDRMRVIDENEHVVLEAVGNSNTPRISHTMFMKPYTSALTVA